MNTTANGAVLFCTCDSGVTTLVSLLSNEFDVRGVLHGQVSLAAVNQIYVFHGAMEVAGI